MAERALATAFVNIVPGTKDLEGYLKGKLQDDVGTGAEQAGGTFSNKFGKGLMGLGAVIGGAFAVTQISQFVGGLVTSAEEGQRVDATLQNITSSMGLFGSSTDTVVSRLQDYATAAMGMTGVDDDLSGRIETLLQQRIEARAAKDFTAADAIRNELDDIGVVVMDGPAGATWRLK
jgi:hypothetical protein